MVNNLLSSAALGWPMHLAVRSSAGALNYTELDARAQAFAVGLSMRGVLPGDRIVLATSNSIDSVAAMHAIWRVGAILSWVHPSTPQNKRSRLAERLGARLMLDDTELATVPLDGACAPVLRAPNDLAAVLFTSGSEGEPKGVMLTHGAMRAAIDAIDAYLRYRNDDVIANALPLSFDYGLYQLLLAAKVGACVWLLPDLALMGKAIAPLRQCTVLPLMPSIVALLRVQDVPAWPELRLITSTGSALAPAQIHWLRERFPAATLYSMYGLTECKRISYLPPEYLLEKPDSVGVAIPGTRIAVVSESGAICAAGVVGELIVKGPTLMRGYWQDAVATARSLRMHAGELALHTGDQAMMDEQGHLYFVGRSDDIIKSRGMKVAPKEVESALLEIEGVIAAAVVGVDDVMQGQAIAAFVELASDSMLDMVSLRRACKARVEDALMPKFIDIVPALPRSANGKIDKTRLRREAWPQAIANAGLIE